MKLDLAEFHLKRYHIHQEGEFEQKLSVDKGEREMYWNNLHPNSTQENGTHLLLWFESPDM